MQERKRVVVQALPILCQAATAVQPSDGALHDPALRQHHELACGRVRALDDLDVDLATGPGETCLEPRPAVAAVGVKPEQERIQPEHGRHHQHAAVSILDVHGVHDRLHQQALRVDQDMALLALDLLPGVVAMRVDRAPPFSAPFTLWLSMMPTVGLASRPACSRHRT